MTRIRPVYAYSILAVIILLFLGRLIVCDFTWWDDGFTIHHNPLMNPVRWDTFAFNWTHATMSIYIPLTYTVWGCLASIAQVDVGERGISLNPWIFHGANVLVHITGAIALWHLLRRLVKNDVACLCGALLWAVHPVQVESVGWISGLKDVMAGTLSIACLLQFLRWRMDGGRWKCWTAFALYVLATLSKASAMTTPLLILVLDIVALRTSWRLAMRAIIPFALATAPIAIIARLVQPALATQYNSLLGPLIAGDSLAFYVVKILAPIHLAYDYGHSPDAILKSGEIWYGWLLPAAIVGLTAIWYTRRVRQGKPFDPVPAVALLFFVLAPLHVLGLTRFEFQSISTVADHYLYVALTGPALLATWLMARWSKSLVPLAGVAIVAFGTRSMLQAPVWQNEFSLMDHAQSINPKSWSSYINLANAIYSPSTLDEARQYLLKAEQIDDMQPLTESDLMSIELETGHYAAADMHARRLLDIYEKFFDSKGKETLPGYFQVIDNYLTNKMVDDADRYLKEAQLRVPDAPGLQYRAQRIHWMRSDPTFRRRTATSSATAPQ